MAAGGKYRQPRTNWRVRVHISSKMLMRSDRAVTFCDQYSDPQPGDESKCAGEQIGVTSRERPVFSRTQYEDEDRGERQPSPAGTLMLL